MATRVLILNRQLAFAVKIKQALEQTNLFDVHPFTKADAAFDFLREHPQDLALVDYTLPGRSGAKVVQQLRAIQPDLAIIISPLQPEADIQHLGLQGMVDMPFSARTVIPMIERALNLSPSELPPQMSPTRRFGESGPAADMTTGTFGKEESQGSRFGVTRRYDDQGEPEPEQPAQTRTFDTPKPPPQTPAQTRILDAQPDLAEPADTGLLEGDTPLPPISVINEEFVPPPEMPQTRDLSGEAPPVPPKKKGRTRNLGDAPLPPPVPQFNPADEEFVPPPEMPQTRDLSGEAPPAPPKKKSKTRSFDDVKPPPELAKTRIFDDEDTPPKPAMPPEMPKARPANFGKTKILDDEPMAEFDESPAGAAATPSEFSSLEDVLRSFGFEEPAIEAEDTPAVPTKDSDALRQFLATNEGGAQGVEAFDDVLGAIDPDDVSVARRKTDEFTGLVRSLQGSEAHTSLPDRQQQLMDFVLTTGMDSVLREIEKTKTGPLPPAPSRLPEEKPDPKSRRSSFQKLIEDEPPMPTLEESGTVSDLLSSISDRSFRNVLSLMRGDEIEEGGTSEEAVTSQEEAEDAFRDFFNPATGRQALAEEQEDPAQIRSVPAPHDTSHRSSTFDFSYFDPPQDDEATVAQVVLQTTLDDVQLPDGFSVDRLMADIEGRLAAHKLNIRPLPSWDMDTSAFRAIINQAEVREPSFLPEELPPGEMVLPEVPEAEQPTRVSTAVREWLEGYAGEADDLGDTMPSERLRAARQAEAVPDDLLSDIEAEDSFASGWAEDEAPVDDLLTSIQADEAASAFDDEWTSEGAGVRWDRAEEAPPDDLLDAIQADEVPAAALPPSWIEGVSDWSFEDSVSVDDAPAADQAEEVSAISPDWMDGDTPVRPQPAQSAVSEPAWLETDPAWGTGDEAPPADLISEMHAEDASAPAVEAAWVQAEDDWALPQETPPRDDEALVGLEAEVAQAGMPDFIDDILKPDQTAAQVDDWTLSDSPASSSSRAVDDWSLTEAQSSALEKSVPVSPEEAYIAQLALNLTQVSLELSSEGTLLTRGNEVVALAGQLSQEDTLELRDAIHNDWDAASDGARLRFINLPSSGKDYMLYSIRTVNNLVLSMVFAGSTPLRVIRQQGQRLIEALESAPETQAESAPVEAAPAPSAGAMVAVSPSAAAALETYAYVWLLRDPEQRLSEAVGHAINTGLNVQLNELRWKIQALQVDENYVYLLADVPGEAPPYEVIGDLQRRSAEIARTQDQTLIPQTLWADSYLVLTPGREMRHEEIQEFIDFQRMM